MIFLIPISVIVGLWVFLITLAKARARVRELQIRERIAMIEKGMAPAPEVDPQGFQRATADVDRTRQMVEIFEYRRRRRPQRHRSAGVTLVKGDLRAIARSRRLSEATMNNIRQNLFFAFVYNALGVPVAAGVLYPVLGLLLSPMIAAAAMSLSSVSVIVNSLRLRQLKL